jgi:hypothetical protein
VDRAASARRFVDTTPLRRTTAKRRPRRSRRRTRRGPRPAARSATRCFRAVGSLRVSWRARAPSRDGGRGAPRPARPSASRLGRRVGRAASLSGSVSSSGALSTDISAWLSRPPRFGPLGFGGRSRGAGQSPTHAWWLRARRRLRGVPVPRAPQPGQRRTRPQRRPRLDTQPRRITPRPVVRPPAGARPPRAHRMNSTAWPAGYARGKAVGRADSGRRRALVGGGAPSGRGRRARVFGA